MFGQLSCEKMKKTLAMMASLFFSLARKLVNKIFFPMIVKIGQHQHKARPHTQKKSLGTATAVEDAIII